MIVALSWTVIQALWLTTLPEAGPKTNHSLGGLRNISFADCVFEGEQGAIALSRDQGGAGARLAGLLFSNVTVIVGVFGNHTRPGVHDLRPLDAGTLEPTQEPQADVTGWGFEHAADVKVVGGSVAFVGPAQPFWAPGAACWASTADSGVSVQGMACNP
jgi:hypothetical protein